MYKAHNARPGSSGRARGIIIGILVGLPIIAIIGAIGYVLFFQPDPELTVDRIGLPASEPQTVQLPWPDDGIAAVGASGYGLLAENGEADTQVPIASVAKLFTALAIMDIKPVAENEQGETIVFDQADEQRYADTVAENGSSYPVNAGDSLTQYDALQALLIPSANNIADSLVLWAFGSEQAYLVHVNDMIAEMGLENTVITDASGMSAGSVSTPRELIVVAEQILEDPVLASIVRQSQSVIDPAVGTIFNTNQLLQEQYVVGVKTGTTDEAGANLVFAADFPLTEEISETIIGVTLGQSEREINTTVSTNLLNASFQGFGFVEVVEENTIVARYEVPWGQDVEIISNGGITIGGWLGTAYEPSVQIEQTEPAIDINTEVGTLEVQAGERITAVPVTTNGVVSEPSFIWRLLNIFNL